MASLEHELKSRFISEKVKASLNVLFTANCINNKINAGLKPFGLTHEQFNVLRILRGQHPNKMCQKDILRRMIARNSNLTLIIKKLVKKEWVEVAQSERDRREYEIVITEKGLAQLTQLDTFIGNNHAEFNTLTESEAFHLNALLDKLRD
jgi:DNA-binding MarR family transcriptional regulator